ncbi:MAG: glycosyltransferase family 2 protein [Bacteroidales bacterium]|nr:glycosyltransferase family 2 protein [Bacteroidales bacterium]
MKLLSIIIPIYNVEPYVERCIRSLENQDINKKEYEIICVNDGSPDNSQSVVEKMQQEFDNIILINQENQGVSRARNNGIERASGKYILFIDPDDYIDADSLKSVLERADKYDAEVSFLGFTFINKDGSIRSRVFNAEYSSRVRKGIEAYYLSRGDGRTDPDRMWAVLFNREFMNRSNLRYLPDVPFLEDGEFIARILCLTERCIFDGRSFYQRTSRPGSATHSNLFFSNRAIKGFLLAAKNLRSFRDTYPLNEDQKEFLNQPVCKFVLLTLNCALQKPFFNNYFKIRDDLINTNFKKIELKGVVKPYIYYARTYNILPLFFPVNAWLKMIKQKIKKILRQSNAEHN